MEEALRNKTLLKGAQIIELFLIAAAFSVSFLMYAFSGADDLGMALSILWKVFLLKIVVLIFFLKDKSWAVGFNFIENIALLLFFVYALYFTIVQGDASALLSFLAMIIIILLVIAFFAVLVKKSYFYLRFLIEEKVKTNANGSK